mmetsp:Transcript_30854/g.67504  ORF Transcript_30854/g.67504 Transcript_30854/m.67504 type:complete len:681 (+) Transcript_30854:47-2089(+)|eukprot:CAMPEP_0170592362 /NCGR_PEP_ID=MMETSP0224-20130122/12884_1 /TAXON_ID=285029 /ORGANISM="Togula jolla, Strain CCCM 725" /LENGTH=680 /DNA_ID=CAMNT_0010916263 /DNA_START=47 /DNA_END=2089 /DNA_ORIENTATION=-
MKLALVGYGTQFTVLLLTAQAFEASYGISVGVTPITKVLDMLKDMASKGRKEKEVEEKQFAAFSQWCDDQSSSKAKQISSANAQIEMLTAKVEEDASRVRSLSSRMAELESDINRWRKDQKSAKTVRNLEASDFKATVQDYSESLDALTSAIAVLKKQAYDRPGEPAESLLELQRLRRIPESTKKALAAFLQQSPDELLVSAPEAHAYEFQSGGVVDMLEKLKAQFGTQKYELEKEELNAQHGFEQIMQQLTDNIKNAEHEVSKKTTSRAESAQSKAEAEGSLAQESSGRDEDQKYLDDVTGLCTMKRSDFASRQELRSKELKTLEEAIHIISSDSVARAGNRNLPSLVQVHRGRATFSQLRNALRSPLQGRIAAFLADRAQTCNSRLLFLMSQRVASDPFDKVKKMIKDLIVRLMEEGTSETEHKGWCDAELARNKVTRDSKTEEAGKLSADVEDLTAEIARITQEVADLHSGVNELNSALATASSERSSSKENNAQTIAEAKEAQVGLEQAITMLKDYYAKSAEATVLAQQSPDLDAPETFDKPYKGMLPESGSVVDFLEVILSDFARLEAEAATSEATEQDEYEKYAFEMKKDKALKENEIEHMESRKVAKESSLHTAQEELKSTQEQLDKAIAYREKLQPTCVDSGVSYEERVKRRAEEIQSLQEALQILAGTDIS